MKLHTLLTVTKLKTISPNISRKSLISSYFLKIKNRYCTVHTTLSFNYAYIISFSIGVWSFSLSTIYHKTWNKKTANSFVILTSQSQIILYLFEKSSPTSWLEPLAALAFRFKGNSGGSMDLRLMISKWTFSNVSICKKGTYICTK